jgi:DNA mismatch repair ATPase MutS
LWQVPLDFERGSGKKGVQRYHTPAIKELLAELAEAEQEKEDALKEIFRKLLQHFCRWVFVFLMKKHTLCSRNGILGQTV